jgi:hypothetical protein
VAAGSTFDDVGDDDTGSVDSTGDDAATEDVADTYDTTDTVETSDMTETSDTYDTYDTADTLVIIQKSELAIGRVFRPARIKVSRSSPAASGPRGAACSAAPLRRPGGLFQSHRMPSSASPRASVKL